LPPPQIAARIALRAARAICLRVEKGGMAMLEAMLAVVAGTAVLAVAVVSLSLVAIARLTTVAAMSADRGTAKAEAAKLRLRANKPID
jgi:hypothetical protein